MEDEGSSGEVEPSPILHLSSLSWLGDLEVGGGGEVEGLVQRYARLRCEVAELQEELESLTESQREGKEAGLSVQVTDLGRRLADCHLEEGATPGGEGAVERVLRGLQGLSTGAGDVKTSPGPYQLYLGREERPSLDLAAVEARLAALERSLGPEPVGERRALSAATEGRSLAQAADTLAAKRTYLQQQHLDHVEGRLAALNLKMNAVGEQKAAVLAARQEDKLSRLCRLVDGQASLAHALPALLLRLEEVLQVGERAAAWQQVLDSTEQGQQETKRSLGDTRLVVEETRATLETSLGAVAGKFAELQAKMQSIKA